MVHARWIEVLIITVAVVVSPVVAVTAVPLDATSPTDEPATNIHPDVTLLRATTPDQCVRLVMPWVCDGTAQANHVRVCSADADGGEHTRSSHLPGADAPGVQVSPDGSLVDVDPADLPGNGTSDDPYIITNASELQATEDDLNATYRLGADIDASNTVGWNGGDGFDPVGERPSYNSPGPPFTGTFEGAGYTITGLHIDRSTANVVGLFGGVGESGRISDVKLTNIAINGSDDVGGLVGVNAGTVRNASASGAVNGSDVVGGLVGRNRLESTVMNLSAGVVRNGFASAAVSGSELVGGLVGVNGGTVRNGFATGAVNGSGLVGGLVGVNEEGTVTESYWDMNTTGQPTSSGGIGLTTAQMTGDTARTNLDKLAFGTVWRTRSVGYPVLDVQAAVTVDASPTAQISVAPPNPAVGQEVSFTAYASTDPDGSIETYQWDLTGDGTVD
ncbi:MAG: hypothetical protein ABEH88_01475 [Halobacteriales archaeon]